ncbi:MAG: sugar phosphate isomerase/epimerase [Candidatus Omnitrophica bacterium]|nr:sugar phosphate isomerase/epimerase [Candidatus Omnitrophota bacterium]MCM8803428.1 sugar phosphate isomerase/epimerase [Candidatus Omnitrophota bacterium]
MKIGVCEKDLPLNLNENLKWIVENRFDGFQIWPNKIENSKELLRFCKDNGIVISAIGGGPNLVNPEKIKETIEEFKKRIEFAILLETNIITAETKELPDFLNEKDGWKWCAEIIGRICELCEKNNIYLSIEPSESCFIKDYYMWAKLSKFVNSKSLKVNYDPANILWAGKNPVEGVYFLKDKIVHTHAKNIIRGEDGYKEGESKISVRDVPADIGEVDYKSYIKALKDIGYKGFLTIEMHSKPNEDRRKDILRSKKFIEKLIGR